MPKIFTRLAFVAVFFPPLLMLVLGIFVGYYGHPYESCSRKHVGEDNIGECVWLKMHSGY